MSDDTAQSPYRTILEPLDPKAYKEDIREAYEGKARAREAELVEQCSQLRAQRDTAKADRNLLKNELAKTAMEVSILQGQLAHNKQLMTAHRRAYELAMRIVQQISKLTGWELTGSSSTTHSDDFVTIELQFDDWHMRIVPNDYLWLEKKNVLPACKVHIDDDGISVEGIRTVIGSLSLAEMTDDERKQLPKSAQARLFVSGSPEARKEFGESYGDITDQVMRTSEPHREGETEGQKPPYSTRFGDMTLPRLPGRSFYDFTLRRRPEQEG